MTQANVLAQLGAQSGPTFRNRIINGAMVIDQRNAGASVTPTSGGISYPLDRFGSYPNVSSKYSLQQNAGSVTPPAGFTNYLGATSLSSYTVGSTDITPISQFIEGYNIADLGWGTANAKTVTLSFWVRSSLTGTFGGSLTSSGIDYSYPYSYTISSANTWEYKTITIAGPTSGTWNTTNGIGVRVYWSLGAGSTYSGTAGSWSANTYWSCTGATSVVGTNGATFYITGVQLEVGSSATGFEYRQVTTELQLCQRYFETSFDLGVVPASASSANGSFEFAQQVAASSTQYGPSCKYAVAKRAASTLTFYNWNAAGNQAVNVVTGGTTTGLALRSGQSGNTSFSITMVTPAGTSAGQTLSVGWTASAEL